MYYACAYNFVSTVAGCKSIYRQCNPINTQTAHRTLSIQKCINCNKVLSYGIVSLLYLDLKLLSHVAVPVMDA